MALIKDKSSLEWIRVKEHITQRLAQLRTDNDRDLDPIETSKIRGMIEFAKEIEALDQERPALQPAASNKYY
jgi:hypothetical protein